jgi:hypothetical protein
MKRINFATTVIESQSYVGEFAGEYVLACFLKNKTADVNGVRVLTDIVKSEFIGKLSGTDLVKCGDNCTFTPTGTLNATEVELTPCTMYINLELCYNDLVGIWNGLQSGNLDTQNLGTTFNKALIDLLVQTMGEFFEDVLWNGTTGTTLTGCSCDVEGIDIQITTHRLTGSTFTKANIVGFVDNAMAALPACVLDDMTKVKLWMNPKSALYYKQALMALGLNTPNTSPLLTYDGVEIIVIGKIADNKIYAFDPSNLAIGVGAMDNFSSVQILDMRKTTLDNSVRMAIQGKVDVKLIYEAEAVVLG